MGLGLPGWQFQIDGLEYITWNEPAPGSSVWGKSGCRHSIPWQTRHIASYLRVFHCSTGIALHFFCFRPTHVDVCIIASDPSWDVCTSRHRKPPADGPLFPPCSLRNAVVHYLLVPSCRLSRGRTTTGVTPAALIHAPRLVIQCLAWGRPQDQVESASAFAFGQPNKLRNPIPS